MGQSETVDLSIEDAFSIAEEFVRSRGANMDDYNPPTYLKASMGGYFAMDKSNAKKELIFTLERISDKRSCVSLDLSFAKDNAAAVAMLVIVLLINAVAAIIPFAGIIIFLVVTLPTLVYLAWWSSGRGKIEKEFWEFFTFKVNELKQKIASEPLSNIGKTGNELSTNLEKIKQELILGKITEQEYRKQKRHIEVAIEDLEDETGSGNVQNVPPEEKDVRSELKRNKGLLESLKKRLIEGKISESAYQNLKIELEEKIKHLESQLSSN